MDLNISSASNDQELTGLGNLPHDHDDLEKPSVYFDNAVGVNQKICFIEVREGATCLHLFNMVFSATWAIFLLVYYQYGSYDEIADDIYGVGASSKDFNGH